jgi:NitT/TauT family transport system substrate-binding protein
MSVIQDSRLDYNPQMHARFLTVLCLLAACASPTPDAGQPSTSSVAERPKVRLGFFPNLTHAPALVGVELGLFERALDSKATLETRVFNAGPSTVEAILSGALDVAYIGPNPTLNAYLRSRGEAVRVIAGASSGGAALVVAPGIEKSADLVGKVLASPQLGGTQDVALRIWLTQQGHKVALQGGDVQILPQENAQTLETFRTGKVAGAWVPEPWVSRLVRDAGAKVLVDERTLWPGGRFVTTHIIARTAWLEANPDLVDRLLDAHLDALQVIEREPAKAREAVSARIGKITGQPIPLPLLEAAWPNLEFTVDPIQESLRVSAENAVAVGLLKPFTIPLDGLYALAPLRARLAARGRPEGALSLSESPAPASVLPETASAAAGATAP